MRAATAGRTLSVLFFVLVLTAIAAVAQVIVTGEIAATVTDPSGAVVPGAELALEDLASESVVSATANEDGGYVFPHLRPGAYRLGVTSKGFQKSVYDNIVVDAGRTTNVAVAMHVGEVSQTVEVTAAPPLVETTSSTVSTTVRVDSLNSLPLAGRDLLAFSLLTPGAQQPAGSERFSTFNGLPGGALNITLDGINNNSQRFHSGDTSMFTFAPLRLGAMEEVTMSTTGLSADATGEGAAQIRFVTKRGSNSFHGNGFEQFRNDVLNANDWFSNAVGAPRQRLRRNEYGGSLGGPLWKKRLFFFFNYEESRQPSTSLRNAPLLTPGAQSGLFRYLGTDGIVRTGDLLQIAASRGFPSTIDPMIVSQLQAINGFAANGNVVGRDLFTNSLTWNQPGNTLQRYPTARVDFQVTPKLLWYGTWNLWWRKILGAPNYPGAPVASGSFKSTYYIASSALDWTISPRLLNQFNFGVQSNVELFNGENKLDGYRAQNNRILPSPMAFGIVPVIPGFVFPQPRNNPVYNYYDNLTGAKGNHNFTFGAAVLRTTSYQFTFGTVGLPQYTFGIVSSDPAASAFNSSSLPAISSSDLPNALALYAVLTGRVSSVTGSRAVSEISKQYSNGNPLVLRDANTQAGIYGQDSWHLNQRLTLNYGLRWELSGAAHNTNGVYTSPDYANLLGPSTAVFQPGTLNGVANPQIALRSYVYNADFVNPAPNLGFAWNPAPEKGWLAKLTGGDSTVVRGSFAISYFHEGLNTFESVASNNPGATQNLFANAGTDFVPGSVTLSGAVPNLNTFPASFSFPIAESLFTFNNGFSSANPKIHTPYVESWNFGIQRRLGKSAAVEVRYVGNHSVHLWRIFNLNEVNIFENGFLREFQNAQSNLASNTANGRTGFANNGLPGQVALPIFQAAFGALGSQPAVSANAGFNNQTFITQLQTGQAGGLANSLAGNSTYLCRLVGSSLPACATRGFNVAGSFPINFFQANPFAAGNTARLLSDPNSGNYNGLQLQLRQSNFHGLSLTANYTWSHSITDRYGDLNSDAFDFFTLRNTRLNRGPAQFDVRHVFQTYFGYALPFGRGRRFSLTNPIVNGFLGGWGFASIIRGNSGRSFQLNSGRTTVNQRDSGVVLVGITSAELQSLVSTRPGPNGTVLYFDPKIIGSDGRSNPAFLTVPTTPGHYGQIIDLYGPSFWNVDADLQKQFSVTEHVRVTFQSLFLNLLNHPNFLVGTNSFIGGNSGTSVGGIVQSIQATTFGQTTSLANGPRNIQLRLQVSF